MNTFTQIALEHFSHDRLRWEGMADSFRVSGDTTEFFSPEETVALRLASELEADLRNRLRALHGVPCELLKAAINLIEFDTLANVFTQEAHAV